MPERTWPLRPVKCTQVTEYMCCNVRGQQDAGNRFIFHFHLHKLEEHTNKEIWEPICSINTRTNGGIMFTWTSKQTFVCHLDAVLSIIQVIQNP